MTTQYVGRDKQGRIIDPGFGSLSYQYKSITRVFRFWPEIVEQGQTLAGSTAQSQFFNHFYAKGHAPQPVGITGRVRDQDMYDDEDSSVTRTDAKFKKIFDEAGMEVIKSEIQTGFPKQFKLLPVKSYALRPKN